MNTVAFVNARLIDPASGLDEAGALVVADGRIAALGTSVEIPEDAQSIDCGGRVLCPGLIDMHAFAVEAKSAIRGGVTTVALMPDAGNAQDDAALVAHAGHSNGDTVRTAVIGAASRDLEGAEMAELGLMTEAGAAAFSDGRKAIADSRIMRRLLEYARRFDRVIIQHPEDPILADGGCMNEGAVATRLGLAGIPAAAEVVMVHRDIELVRLTGARLHFAQISAAGSVRAIAEAKKEGLPVTCGVTPHHLMMNETAIGDYLTFLKVSPPLRTEEDRLALVAGLADGTIDVICSAHDPQDEDAKRRPFAQAADGIVGFETLLALSLNLHHGDQADLTRILDALTASPAKILGLEQGRLARGAPADLLIFDPDAPWRVDVTAFASATHNAPFDTLPVQGKVWKTVVAGTVVFDGAQ